MSESIWTDPDSPERRIERLAKQRDERQATIDALVEALGELVDNAPMTSRCMTTPFSDAQMQLRLEHRAKWGHMMERGKNALKLAKEQK